MIAAIKVPTVAVEVSLNKSAILTTFDANLCTNQRLTGKVRGTHLHSKHFFSEGLAHV